MLVFRMHEINVLYTFDTRFWRMAAVSINSLMTTQTNTIVNVYCMVAPHTRGKRFIRKIIRKHGGKLIWKQIRRRTNPFRHHDFNRWSPVIFYRLFAHRIFPNLDKILYLDSDTLVQKDLSELYRTDLSGYAIGAVRDMAPTDDTSSLAGKYVSEFKQKHLKHDLYINSGVLLINIKEIKNHEHDLLTTKIKLKYPDQDIINAALDGKILELPLKYNFVPSRPKPAKFSECEYTNAIQNPHIYHFYAVKPYYYHLVSRHDYSLFARAAIQIGMYPDQFQTQEERYIKKHIKHSKN